MEAGGAEKTEKQNSYNRRLQAQAKACTLGTAIISPDQKNREYAICTVNTCRHFLQVFGPQNSKSPFQL